jgi:nucleoside-diphosphate-sugar epimerase
VNRLHVADLADLPAIAEIVDRVRPEKVAHLAAIAFVAHEDVEAMYRSNVVGTRQLLDALSSLEHRPNCVLVASSANIYGNSHEGVLDEDIPASPANDYGVSKLAVENLARIYSDRLPIIIVRPFNYTGVGQHENFVVPKIVGHARRREPAIELGNLDVSRDFSDVRMVVEAYARLLDTPKAVGGTFNVCSGEPTPLRKIVELVEDLSGHSMDVRVNPAFVRTDEVRSLCGSHARLESVIGPLSQVPLRETLRWMLEA